jgi:hypothetical protein
MKLWLLTQSKCEGYDTYSDAVVAAETEDAARRTHPSEYYRDDKPWDGKWSGDWCAVADVRAELIGEAVAGTKAGVVCASFHAG